MAQTAPAPRGASGPKGHKTTETTGWIVGVILIVLGVAFFLQNLGYVSLTGNWWAVFIYLAAFASLTNAWREYRKHDGFEKAGTGSLVWGLVLGVVATIFLFNLLWDQWWPAILIAIGVGIVVGYALRSDRDEASQAIGPADAGRADAAEADDGRGDAQV